MYKRQEGYHARTYAIKLTGYHVCRVTTPELPRSKQTSGYRQVTTPAGSFYLFFLSSVIRQSIHNNNNFSTEPGAHLTDPLNIHDVKHVHACWQRASPVCRLGRVCHVPLSPQAYLGCVDDGLPSPDIARLDADKLAQSCPYGLCVLARANVHS